MAKFTIATLNNISPVGLNVLSDDYQVTDDLAGADGILVRSAKMHDMEIPDTVLAVARAGAGTNNIPVDEYAEKGIVVFNTPGANANAVKELVLAGMFLASRDIIGGVNWVQSVSDSPTIAKDVEKGKKAFAGHEIYGASIGVIGLGAIGSKVANDALALGMKVYGYDPYLSLNAAWNISRDVIHVQNLADIYANCDYITIHVPLLDSTKGMIGEEAIASCKDGVVILNFARGGLVDDDAMAAALESGKVSRYVTDFPNEKSANMKGCIAIPHLGASTAESEENCAKMAAEEISDYLENGNIRNSVNYPACELGPIASMQRLCVLHRNVPNMLSPITGILGRHGINIADMAHKARGNVAYALFDIEAPLNKGQIAELRAIEGVLRVVVIDGKQA